MSRLAEAFREIDGVKVRAVATLGSVEYDVEYIREDLRDAYSERDIDQVYRSLMANQVSSDDLGRITEFGAFEFQTFVFEEVVAFMFPMSRYGAIYVAFDREEEFPVFEVMETAEEVLPLAEEKAVIDP